MTGDPPNQRGRRASTSAASDPYCTFNDDRERRNALVSRDLRILGCRLISALSIVTVAVMAPTGSAVELLAMVGRLLLRP